MKLSYFTRLGSKSQMLDRQTWHPLTDRGMRRVCTPHPLRIRPRLSDFCKLGGTHFRFSWYNEHTFCASRVSKETCSAGKVYVSGQEITEDGSRFTGGAAACQVEPGRLSLLGPLGPAAPHPAQATRGPHLYSLRSTGAVRPLVGLFVCGGTGACKRPSLVTDVASEH